MAEYVLISEFAELVNLKRQTIYKRIDKDLQPFVKIENDKKVISLEALKLFGRGKEQQRVDNQGDNELTTTVDTMRQEIDSLKEQLHIKDEQLKAKDEQIVTLTKLLEHEQQLVKAEQALNGGNLQAIMLALPQAATQPEEAEETEKPKKRHWWNRK